MPALQVPTFVFPHISAASPALCPCTALCVSQKPRPPISAVFLTPWRPCCVISAGLFSRLHFYLFDEFVIGSMNSLLPCAMCACWSACPVNHSAFRRLRLQLKSLLTFSGIFLLSEQRRFLDCPCHENINSNGVLPLFPSCWLQYLSGTWVSVLGRYIYIYISFSQAILTTKSKCRDSEESPSAHFSHSPTSRAARLKFQPILYLQLVTPAAWRASGDKLSGGHSGSKGTLFFISDISVTVLYCIFDDFHYNSSQIDNTRTIYLSGKQAWHSNPETDRWDLNHF